MLIRFVLTNTKKIREIGASASRKPAHPSVRECQSRALVPRAEASSPAMSRAAKSVVFAGEDSEGEESDDDEWLDDVEDTPFEEIQLQHPMGANHAPPRIRSLAVVAGENAPSAECSLSGPRESKRQSGTESASGFVPPAPRAADRPWGVDGDNDELPPGRFPTKPRGVTPWALADTRDALEQTRETTSATSRSIQTGGSTSSSS